MAAHGTKVGEPNMGVIEIEGAEGGVLKVPRRGARKWIQSGDCVDSDLGLRCGGAD